MAWDQLNYDLRVATKSMPSAVIAALDHRLVEGTTYIYQIMQTKLLQVTVVSAKRMNFLRFRSAHSLQGLEALPLQITKCLDFTRDNKQIYSS